MVFARKVWWLLVGIKDALALIVLILFFLVLYAALSARPSTRAVRDGALLLKLDGAIVEEPAQPQPLQLLLSNNSAPVRQYAASDLVRALRAAATDARIKAVVLDLSRFTGGGQVVLHDVGAALDQVRVRKPVLTFADLYTDDGIQLAAHASEVWVDPLGGAVPTGPGGSNLYFGPLLERLKITAHVFRVGTYKSAVEPFLRGDMSPEAKENARALYGALWEDWQAEVAKARPKANIALAIKDPVGWIAAAEGDTAKAALAAGLVDRVGDAAQFGDRVAQLAGRGDTRRAGGYARTSLDTWLAANPPPSAGRAIGVITVAGDVLPGRAGPGSAGGDRIAKLLDDAADDNLAALVVRIDSPGGGTLAGEQIRAAIARYKARHIPVVVSMSNLAASAAYWIATPADRIFAEPATITGSIGVFGIVPTFEHALAQYGVNADGIRTTPLSGQPDIVAGLSPEFAAVTQASVNNIYARFVGLVAAARHKTPAQIDAIGQGRVWDGGSARQLGLVDQFGGIDDALAYAANAAGLKDGGWHAQYLRTEEPALAKLLRAFVANSDDADAEPASTRDWASLVAERRMAEFSAMVDSAMRIAGTGGIEAYCTTCPVEPGAARPAPPADSGLLGLLARLLPALKAG